MNGVSGVRHLEPTTASAADEYVPIAVGSFFFSPLAQDGCRRALTTANQSLVESIVGSKGTRDMWCQYYRRCVHRYLAGAPHDYLVHNQPCSTILLRETKQSSERVSQYLNSVSEKGKLSMLDEKIDPKPQRGARSTTETSKVEGATMASRRVRKRGMEPPYAADQISACILHPIISAVSEQLASIFVF